MLKNKKIIITAAVLIAAIGTGGVMAATNTQQANVAEPVQEIVEDKDVKIKPKKKLPEPKLVEPVQEMKKDEVVEVIPEPVQQAPQPAELTGSRKYHELLKFLTFKESDYEYLDKMDACGMVSGNTPNMDMQSCLFRWFSESVRAGGMEKIYSFYLRSGSPWL